MTQVYGFVCEMGRDDSFGLRLAYMHGVGMWDAVWMEDQALL